MKRMIVRRGAVGIALGALAVTGLASVPASALVTDPKIGSSVSFSDASAGCTRAGAASGPAPVAWSDNGVAASQSYSASGTHTRDVTPTDVIDVSASGSATVTSTPLTGGPATVSGTASAKASATSRLAATACNASAYANPHAEGEVKLAQPMWVTVTASGEGNGYGGVWFEDQTTESWNQVNNRGKLVSSFLVAAGDVEFGFGSYAYAYANGDQERNVTYTGTYKIEFQPLGAASVVSGKGKAYTVFGARDCANGNVAAAITKKAKKKAEQVLIKVNGAKVAKLKGKKLKKRTLVLPAAPASAAAVEATIKLKNGKKVTVTRSYLACS